MAQKCESGSDALHSRMALFVRGGDQNGRISLGHWPAVLAVTVT